MIEFAKYAKVKDRYCLCYFGPNEEYLLQLKLLKPVVERHFPGIVVGLGCRDDRAHILEGLSEFMKVSEFKAKMDSYGHIREIVYNGASHPILDLVDECGISDCTVVGEPPDVHTRRCVIVTQATYPTKNLEKRQIDILKKTASEAGYDVELDTPITRAGLVMGAESYNLFDAASRGIRTKLVPTGIGTRLYKLMFPFGEVLHT